jgi:hypothetical protein
MPHRAHPRKLIYADVTDAEYATVKRLCARDKLSIANLMRRAINSLLLEEGLEDDLLEEQRRGRLPARADA